ncbi:DNA cytosine methyltransferase [Allofustis seminis]|uniref:DNA cytosine methyltransferase n=1 Tax=Allofustis seminis TaxID=166939 RepID=UPI0003718D6D|nr:DNA cytosine methyltransferase [Allofustis seminis]
MRFTDLFAGIGGTHQAFKDENTVCVFSSGWDKFAQKTYKANYDEIPHGDLLR